MRGKLLAAALLACATRLCASPVSEEVMREIVAFGVSAGVPASVTRQLAWEESRLDARAVSQRTEEGYQSHGLFQLYDKPSNIYDLVYRYWKLYHEVGPFNVYDPRHNARVALRYLAALHERFGNWTQALWFYNCGRARNPPQSTRDYASRIVNAR